MQRYLHYLILVCVFYFFILPVTSWSAVHIKGSISNNKYTSPNGELSVSIPSIKSIQISDGNAGNMYMVSFIPSDAFVGLYESAGYLIEWFKLSKPPTDTLFIRGLPDEMRLVQLPKQDGLMKKPSCKFIKIHDTRGYQCMSYGMINNIPMGFTGTIFSFKGQLIMVFVNYITKESNMPWAEYNHLIDSIHVNK